ncbi:site-2 protease family protein [Azospirillum oleiclasticum]|uniref:site-2 protease family protein n=1 Tax=Azospirillum oleiclasticum TaxID=2735135 RepID=UPI0015D4D55C|nr:site-2 protease family protein [Azospirillum oleiclasticum]
MGVESWLFTATAVAIPAILAITLHEAAHGWAAWKLGDDTAKVLGRVTFNPLRHIDPFGTVILPALMYFTTGFVFGWAKPVPVNFNRLNNPRMDMVKVAIAGPAINFVLALVSAWLWGFLPADGLGGGGPTVGTWAKAALEVSVFVNVILMVFNLIPLPPLDGGRVAVGLLPDALAVPLARMERVGLLLLIGVLFLLPMLAREFGYDLNLLGWILGPPVDAVIEVIRVLTGND